MSRVLTVDDSVYILARLQPDLAIIDIVLPRLGGIDVTRRLHAIVPQAGIVVYSAYAHDEKARAALDAGAFVYVVTTPDSGPLLAAVEKALAR